MLFVVLYPTLNKIYLILSYLIIIIIIITVIIIIHYTNYLKINNNVHVSVFDAGVHMSLQIENVALWVLHELLS